MAVIRKANLGTSTTLGGAGNRGYSSDTLAAAKAFLESVIGEFFSRLLLVGLVCAFVGFWWHGTAPVRLPAFYERQAKRQQEKFCQRLAHDEASVATWWSEDGKQPLETQIVDIRPPFLPFRMHVYKTPPSPQQQQEGDSHAVRGDLVSQNILENGAFQVERTRSMIKRIRDYASDHNVDLTELTFVDVGAHIGWFSLVFASMGLNVHAIEPLPQNVYVLRKTLCLPQNKYLASRITLHAKGLSTKRQVCEAFSQVTDMGGGGQLVHCTDTKETHDRSDQFHELGDSRARQVPMVRLDDLVAVAEKQTWWQWLATHLLWHKVEPYNDIVALKLNTGGGDEQLAVQGGPHVVGSNIPYIFLEFNPVYAWKKTGGQPLSMLRDMMDMGYTVREENKQVLSREQVLDPTTLSLHHRLILEYNDEDQGRRQR